MHDTREWLAMTMVVTSLGIGMTACSSEPGAEAVPATPVAPVASGTIQHWGEAKEHLNFDFGANGDALVSLGAGRAEGLDAFWSIASTSKTGGGTGFFYADAFRANKEARVARADGIASIADLRDASTLSYSTTSVGPVPVGSIVVIAHAPSRRYLALVLDAIEPTDPRAAGAGPYAYADVRWYLTAEGSADFGGAR